MLILTTTSSCNNKPNSSSITHDTVDVVIPDTFVKFYQRFHQDSTYQMEHIVFPLPQKEDGTLYTREDWELNKSLDIESSGFQRDLDNFQNIITETLTHKQGLYTLERRFSPMGNKDWSLIYYSVSNPMKDSWEKIEDER